MTSNADSFDEENLGIAAAYLSDLANNENITAEVNTGIIGNELLETCFNLSGCYNSFNCCQQYGEYSCFYSECQH